MHRFTTPALARPCIPAGTWLSHYPTAGLYMIHMNLMHDGKVVGWSTVSAERGYGTAVCDPLNPRTWPLPGQKHLAGAGCQQILGRQGISGGKNHFCAGEAGGAPGHPLPSRGGRPGGPPLPLPPLPCSCRPGHHPQQRDHPLRRT